MKEDIIKLIELINILKDPIPLYDTIKKNLASYCDQSVALIGDKGTDREGRIYRYQHDRAIYDDVDKTEIIVADKAEIRDAINFEQLMRSLTGFRKNHILYKGMLEEVEKYGDTIHFAVSNEALIEKVLIGRYDIEEVQKGFELIGEVLEEGTL